MTGERYVLLGLAQARSSWFATVAHWATSGTIPAEFVKCVSSSELRARLGTGRPFSAVLVDASCPELDRDLVAAARAAGCACLVVEDRRATHDWAALGVAGRLPEYFDPATLLELLRVHAPVVGRHDELPGTPPPPAPTAGGRVVTVAGPGGTGASTLAIALAQALAGAPGPGGVVLADLALHAEQAMLHDSQDVVPGLQELVEAHRAGQPPAHAAWSHTFAVAERGYRLLLGLRRARAWSALRPAAFTAAFASLRAAFDTVVCDTDADVEGEEEGGSIDVEERNLMARTAALEADVVMAVGAPGMKGVHTLVRVLNELQSAGVAPERLVPVVNRAPRGGRARAEMAAAVAGLAEASGRQFGPVLFVPERRVEEALRDGVALPAGLADPLAGAYRATVGRLPAAPGGPGAPVAVRPGSLGSWSTGAGDDLDEAGEAAFG